MRTELDGVPCRAHDRESGRMGSLSEAVARAVLQHFPYALCPACLATALSAPEPEVRSAAQLLIVNDGFRTATRICHRCSRTDETLVPEKSRE